MTAFTVKNLPRDELQGNINILFADGASKITVTSADGKQVVFSQSSAPEIEEIKHCEEPYTLDAAF